MTVLEEYQHRHSDYLTGLSDDPPWLNQVRMKAFESLVDLGFPTQRSEHWRYLPMNQLTQSAFDMDLLAPTHFKPRLKPDPKSAAEFDLSLLGTLDLPIDAYKVVFCDNQLVMADLELLAGVTIKSLQQAISDNEITLRQLIEQETENPFSLLNQAFLSDGLFISVPANKKLEKPVYLISISRSQSMTMFMPSHYCILGENSEAVFVEHHCALENTSYFTNTKTHLHTERAAILTHVKITQESDQAMHVGQVLCSQGEESEIKQFSLSLSGRVVRHDIFANLNQPKSRVELNGLYLGYDRNYVDHHTWIKHLVSDCKSEETYHGIVNDRSRAIFNGQVYVEKNAQRTESAQYNHNLLLSRNAEIDTKPELEIYADDVKCAHGATVGQIDESKLFYLQSRGIAQEQARHLLVEAFLMGVIDRLPENLSQVFCSHLLSDYLSFVALRD